MKISRFLMGVSVAVLLSACNTLQGVQDDVKDTSDWFHGRPAKLEQSLGRMPTGYYGQNRHNMGQPAAQQEAPVAENAELSFPIDDNSVTTYPVDEAMPLDSASYGYGDKVHEMYFLHGSSRITKSERSDLQQVAEGIKSQPAGVAVTVVGHASQRVDGVSDPVRKKMINFEMAQKRANAVTNVLKDSGVAPEWVQAVSKGDEEPNMSPGGRAQEAADRRVEVFVGNQ